MKTTGIIVLLFTAFLGLVLVLAELTGSRRTCESYIKNYVPKGFEAVECSPNNFKGRDAVYVRDPRTNLCFLVNGAGVTVSMVNVPCENLRALSKNPQTTTP